MEQKQIEFDFPQVELISYNDINPASIKLDLFRLIRRGVYCFGDLHNILPPGLKIPPPNNRTLRRAIARALPLRSKKYSDTINFIKNFEPILPPRDTMSDEEKKYLDELDT